MLILPMLPCVLPPLHAALDHFSDVVCKDPWPPKHGYQNPRTTFYTEKSSVTIPRPPEGSHPYSNALAVVIVRNPWDWATAMHRKCW